MERFLQISQTHLQQTATVILVSEDKRSPYALQNGSAASQNIMPAAHSLGIGTVWVNALYSTCDEIELREFLTTLGVPQSHLIDYSTCNKKKYIIL